MRKNISQPVEKGHALTVAAKEKESQELIHPANPKKGPKTWSF